MEKHDRRSPLFLTLLADVHGKFYVRRPKIFQDHQQDQHAHVPSLSYGSLPSCASTKTIRPGSTTSRSTNVEEVFGDQVCAKQ